MNVTVVQVQTPKTQMYLYWVRVTEKSTCTSKCFFQRDFPFGQVKYFCKM